MRVTIFDYGAGNLHSLAKAIEASRSGGADRGRPDARDVDTDALVLPGVGAFGAAAGRLAPGRDAMRDAIRGGLPTLGICLGMQLLFDASDEGAGAGLGVIAGRVSRLEAQRVPQIGWNALESPRDPLFDVAPLSIAYYANSFVCRPIDPSGVIAWSTARGRSLSRRGARGIGGRRAVPSREELGGRRALAARIPRRGSHRREVAMIAIPAVDLRDGACVQLVGGSYAEERVRLDESDRGRAQLGALRLPSAARRRSRRGHRARSNLSLIRDILADANVPVQVGGGIRSDERVEELLAAGAARVIVGTRAIEERDWLAELAQRHPGQIIVACDVRERRVTTRGWAHTLPVDILDVVEELNGLPLGGLLVTAVHREGQLRGTDLPLMEDVAESVAAFPSTHRVA